MKEMEKKVETTKIVYVADDGKEFDTKDKCLSYEAEASRIKNLEEAGIHFIYECESINNGDYVYMLTSFNDEADLIKTVLAMKDNNLIADEVKAIASFRESMGTRHMTFPLNNVAFTSANYDSDLYLWSTNCTKDYIDTIKKDYATLTSLGLIA